MLYRNMFKRRNYVFVLAIFTLFFYTFCCLQADSQCKLHLSYVVVHIDLKRTPSNLDYLTQLLSTLKGLRVNGLLMEYEDMFPYEGKLVNLKAENSYTKEKLKHFLITCNNMGIEVIPLVQTFGHMEYVLKLEEFRHLREDDNHTNSICPSNENSLTLIKNILTQVMDFHNSVVPLKHIHIGCDEVFHLNICQKCILQGLTNSQLYVDHVRTVTLMVKTLSKDTNVLFWDDMIRKYSLDDIQAIAPLEPVIWDYRKNFKVSHIELWKYHRTFPNIWIASAYKGADGEKNLIPDIKNRFQNHFSWMNGIHDYRFGGENEVFNFKGIILTGWSRYAHFYEPCDILPASIPSLILNLLLIAQCKEGIYCKYLVDQSSFYETYLEHRFKYILDCDRVDIHLQDTKADQRIHFDNIFLGSCNFTEINIYKSMKNYLRLKHNVTMILQNESITYKEYERWCGSLVDEIYKSRYTLLNNMNPYYGTDFVTDYVTNLTTDLRKSLDAKCISYGT